MNKNITFAVAFLLCQLGFAQMQITGSRFNVFNVQPKSLLELDVINTGQEQLVNIEATLARIDGSIIMRVIGTNFLLKNGSNFTKDIELGTVSTDNSSMVTAIQNTRMLPAGTYNYCCVVTNLSGQIQAEWCNSVESDITSPPILINPFDKETVHTGNPVFNWSLNRGTLRPISTIGENIETQDRYAFILVELSNEQKADAGLAVNPPIFAMENVRGDNLQYPIDGKKLVSGQRYGWQIIHLIKGVVIDKSEAWEFTLGGKSNEIIASQYIRLNQREASRIYPVIANIGFLYKETSTPGPLKYRILDELGNPTETQASLISKVGDNKFTIPVDDLKKHKIYMLEVKNMQGEVYTTKFRVFEDAEDLKNYGNGK